MVDRNAGKRLFNTLRKHVRAVRVDYSLLEWDGREYQDGDWTCTVMGLTEAAKDEWQRAADALGVKP